MIRLCCKCKRIWVNDHWEVPSAEEIMRLKTAQDITHCYCEDCFQIEMEKINSHKNHPLDALPTSAD